MSRAGARLFVLTRLLIQFHRLFRQRKSPPRPTRILVLHQLLLGDALMLTPLLARIAACYPDAERFVACPAAIASLYARRPFGFIALPWQSRNGDIEQLRAQAPFDLVLIPAENRHSPLARALGNYIVGFSEDVPAWKNWLLDEAHPFPESPAAFGDLSADLIDGPEQIYDPRDWPLPEHKSFELPSGRYAVLHLGASTPLKYWPAERWAILAERLMHEGVVPVWSAGQKETHLVRAADPEGRYPSFAGQLDLPQLARLFASAQLIVCPDTGVAHLARITDTPTVALFGPGSSLVSGPGKYWQNSPFTALSVDIACRNQHNTFRRHRHWIQRCSRGFGSGRSQCATPECMQRISVEAVWQACLPFLG